MDGWVNGQVVVTCTKMEVTFGGGVGGHVKVFCFGHMKTLFDLQ
jgi:hypothetical protein